LLKNFSFIEIHRHPGGSEAGRKANAGAQSKQVKRCFATRYFLRWIPAFAGMTSLGR
jgi:hypothetical protein